MLLPVSYCCNMNKFYMKTVIFFVCGILAASALSACRIEAGDVSSPKQSGETTTEGDTSTTEGTPSSVTPAEPETVPPENSYAMTGTNGTLYAYTMSGKSVSFWFTPSKKYAKCSLYCSLGNATGLAAADKTMSKDDKGTWTYTVTSDSYTAGAKIYAIIITN